MCIQNEGSWVVCTMEILPVPPLYRLQGENSGFSKKLMNKQANLHGSPARYATTKTKIGNDRFIASDLSSLITTAGLTSVHMRSSRSALSN